jgi:hypothetical protein
MHPLCFPSHFLLTQIARGLLSSRQLPVPVILRVPPSSSCRGIYHIGLSNENGIFFGINLAVGVGAGVLGEMDEIDRRAALLDELGDFFLELGGGRGGVASFQCSVFREQEEVPRVADMRHTSMRLG